MVPTARGGDHFFGFKNATVAFRATILIAFLGLDDPSLDGGASQHIVLIAEQLGDGDGSGVAQLSRSGHRSGFGAVRERIAAAAVDFAVGAFATRHRVELLAALDAAEAVLVIAADASDHALRFEDFSHASRASRLVALAALNGLDVHPAFVVGLHAMTELFGVTVFAVNFAIGAVEEARGVQIALALVTRETVLVDEAAFGHDLFGLEDFAVAANAGLGVRVVGLNEGLVAELVLTAGPEDLRVTNSAVDFVVGAFDGLRIVQVALAFDAGETLFMVKASFRVHLFGLENHSTAPGAIGGLSVLAGDHGGVGHARVSIRPRNLIAANRAVNFIVGPDLEKGDVDHAVAVVTHEALLMERSALDDHFLGVEDSAAALGAAAVLAGRLDRGRV